ncbi:hypothetical protein Sinac_0444 [Singulisphaera acidiphila DSM 18658]|uniref:Uncharacterized protein n=1 Tax=Singulisphaera acidiphila (strain ATCC BAA-1392 / DSM 18658 / VKM B-2454 / MOB10) TaxID=886293 RepID=L0D8D8_SINAD|nr:hypothetical protein Sinac_0444 [Singulisphaera acidiphila DSM 18658]
MLVEVDHADLSVRRQCELLGLSRSRLDCQPISDTPENLRLMRLIEKQYMACPLYGSGKLAAWLDRQGKEANRKRVQPLIRTVLATLGLHLQKTDVTFVETATGRSRTAARSDGSGHCEACGQRMTRRYSGPTKWA